MKLPITVLCISLTYNILAQDLTAKNNTYFFLGLGVPLVKVKDLAHSPLTYRGIAPTLRVGYESNTTGYLSRISFSASFGSANPKSKPKAERTLSSLMMTNVQFNFAYYKQLGTFSTEGDNSYLGGNFSFYLDMRDYNLPSNNLTGYMINTSLNVGGFYQNKMSDKWRLNYEAYTPLLTYSLRPNYIGMLPLKGEDFSPKKILSTGRFATFDKFFRFYNRFAFDQQIKTYRSRRLSYFWDYHWNAISKPIKSVTGGVGYESFFKM
jgi:hypothetical protein